MECSRAIKCPSIDVHLTTFKKFQQAFSDESLLNKVMGESHKHDTDMIKQLFKGIWSLESMDTDIEVKQLVQQAIQNPDRYVIKPQMEGGGHNFYGEKVKQLLLKSQESESDLNDIKKYLIMERIEPPEVKAYMLKNGALIEA